MRVLLLDSSSLYPANPLFAEPLAQLAHRNGFQHEIFDEGSFTKALASSIPHRVFYKVFGRRPATYWMMNQSFLDVSRSFRPNVVVIAKGMYLSPATLRTVKAETGAVLINYATDDPFNRAVNSSDLVNSIPLYDFYACTKTSIREDVQRAGCVNAVYVPFGYKPDVHFPEAAASSVERDKFSCDVAFIGGCDSDRLPIIRELLRAIPDLKLRLYGGFWHRYRVFRKYYGGWVFGREYRLALGGAKIALNLVRRANRDGHVMRTFEIPACGAFMLTDRTDEQREFLDEDKETVFFSCVTEMIEKIRYFLNRDSERQTIAEAGYARITRGRNTYRDRLEIILRLVGG